MTAAIWVGVVVLGGVGAVLRFLLDGEINRWAKTKLPIGTLVINVTGAMLLGFLAGADLSGAATLILGTGLLGAYTTFSTWMFETQRLVEERQVIHAAGNVVVSLSLGIAAAALGLWLGGGMSWTSA